MYLSPVERLVTNHYIVCNRLGMFRPHVPCGMFVVSSSSLRRDQLQGVLGIGCDADTSAYFAECWRSFIDLDVYMGLFEQGDGSAEATDASTDNCDTKGFRRGGRC